LDQNSIVNEILNPYIAGAPVVEASMFFGREDVFNWIERSLAGKYVDNILVLHGQRRVGKTSVLKQIPNFLPEKYIQVFFDLQGRTGTTLERFLWWLASEIVRTLKTEHDLSLPKPDRGTFEDADYLINEFLPGLRSSLGDKVLLLTFDEFDSLDRPEIRETLAQPLIAYLRRLIEMDGLNFIFSIGSSGDKLENMQASYTDFFKSALYRKISFLTRDDCHRLITKPVEGLIRFEKNAVDQIFKITSGHPYFTQLMCHELFSRCQKTGEREISARDVEAVLDDVIERGTVNLKFIWDEASDLEKWVLAALAQMGGGDKQKLTRLLEAQRVRFSDPDLNSAIIRLQDKDVLRPDLSFVIQLMRMWLVANRPMDRVREELVEVNPIANRYIEIGDEYRDRQQYQEAIESYQQALNVDAGNLKAQTSIGSVYMALEDYYEAVTAFNAALQIDDEDVVSRTGYCEANLALGDAAQSTGEMGTALRYYEAILVINAAHTDARQRMASIYQEQAEKFLAKGRDEEALDAFKQAMMSTPEDDRLSTRYEKVLEEKKSEVINAWLAKAEKALSRQRWDEAAEMFEEAIKVDPENRDLQAKLLEVKDAPRQFKLDGYRREAEQAISQGNWEKAIAALETAVLLSPEDSSLADRLAALQEDQLSAQLDFYAQQVDHSLAEEKWDAAIRAVQSAIKLAPEDEIWQRRLDEINQTRHQARLDSLRAQVSTARDNNDWDRAIQYLEELLELEDSEKVRAAIEEARSEKHEVELTSLRSQAECATEAENWSEAVKAWEAYLALSPTDAESVEGQVEHARKYARISSDYEAAQDALRRRRYSKAIELLQGIIRQDPTYKSTSRLLVEAVEANKAIPIWRRPWMYGAIGAIALVILGVIIGPTLLKTFTPDPRVLNPKNNHLYLHSLDAGFETESTWVEARDYCASQGGHLVTIQDVAENEFVYELTNGSSWLGATDEEQEGTWLWVTGEPVQYTNWNVDEPSNLDDEDYLFFEHSPQWRVTSSSDLLTFTCEWDLESATPVSETPEFATLESATSEPSPNPTADLRVLNLSNNHLYLNSRASGMGGHSWEFARDDCASQGGYLVTIQDAAENEFVRELADFMDQSWLGATDIEEEGTWVWITGEPWEYENWNPGEGPDFGENPDYLILNEDSGWSAIDATEVYLSGKTPRLYYVCEWDQEPVTPESIPTQDLRILNPENHHLYRWFGDPTAPSGTNWKSAQSYCEALGGYLVTIQDAAENEFLDELSPGQVWIGATDEEQEGEWVWVTGEPWDYTNWDTSEPSNNDGEHYLYLTWRDVWDDVDLSVQMDFVCEWDPEPEKPEPVPTSTPDTRIFNPENQHFYFYSWGAPNVTPKVWLSAMEYCERQGGYLVSIQDAAENEFIHELLGDLPPTWLGATDEEEDGTWVWASGEPWQYTNWEQGEPSGGDGEHYLTMDYGNGQWNDLESSYAEPLEFVCEWDPDPDWDWGVSAGGTFAPIFEHISDKSPTFEDDFSTSKSEWGVTSVGTLITDMRQDETLWLTNPGSDVAFPVNGLFNATNFVMSFDFFPDKEDSTGVLEVAFRASQNLEIYYKFKFSFSYYGLRDAWLFSQNDGTMTRTSDNGGVSLMNDYNRIQFIVHEEMLGVFVNEELVFEKIDLERWGDENFIIFPTGERVSFDNFRFWDLDEVEFDE
jgi:tetratricopeptide (TPR) repeat protein